MESVTILDALKGVNAYPIPLRTLVEVAERHGLSLEGNISEEILKSRSYNLSVADLLLWLCYAPNITQGGQSYSFTDEQRLQFRNRANALYEGYGEDEAAVLKPLYGYKGNRL